MKTIKIAYNSSFGGFSLPDWAIIRGKELSGNPEWDYHEIPRHNPVLVQVIQEILDRYDAALKRAKEISGKQDWGWGDIKGNSPMEDPIFAQITQELGSLMRGCVEDLALREVPYGSRYRIAEYDGYETIILETEEKWITAK